jgi:LPXTG-motif cell wall-anchored protein
VRAVQSLCYTLAAFVGLLLVGGFMVNSAQAQPASTAFVSQASQCEAPCSTGQGLNLTILPPGVTPPPPPPPPVEPPSTVPPTADDAGPGGGKGGTNAGGPTKLPKTGPRETAIAALLGLALLQGGLILSVRTARAVPRSAH